MRSTAGDTSGDDVEMRYGREHNRENDRDSRYDDHG